MTVFSVPLASVCKLVRGAVDPSLRIDLRPRSVVYCRRAPLALTLKAIQDVHLGGSHVREDRMTASVYAAFVTTDEIAVRKQ